MVYADTCQFDSTWAYVLSRACWYSRPVFRKGALQPNPYSSELLVHHLQHALNPWTFPRWHPCWQVRITRKFDLLLQYQLPWDLIILLGAQSADYGTLCAGFCVMGSGTGSVQVAVPVLLTSWFKGKHISMAFGMMLSIIGAAAVLNSLVEPALASSYGVPAAIWFAFGVQIFSFLIMLIAVFLNRYAIMKDGIVELSEDKEFKMRQVCELGWPFWLFTAAVVFKACYIVPGQINQPRLYCKVFNVDE